MYPDGLVLRSWSAKTTKHRNPQTKTNKNVWLCCSYFEKGQEESAAHLARIYARPRGGYVFSASEGGGHTGGDTWWII
jgi:hypothetical protein